VKKRKPTPSGKKTILRSKEVADALFSISQHCAVRSWQYTAGEVKKSQLMELINQDFQAAKRRLQKLLRG
jgi:N-acetylmuramic acid 6-phosphate (MurNAc-6-P) etherase